jgi:hypothetical protein
MKTRLTAPWPVAAVLATLALFALLALSANRKAAAFGLAWFGAAVLPVLFFTDHIFAYYLAPALPGFSFMLSAAVDTPLRSARRKLIPVSALLVFSLWSAIVTLDSYGTWWTNRSLTARSLLMQTARFDRTLPRDRRIYVLGLTEDDCGVLQDSAAFRAFGYPPERLTVAANDADAASMLATSKNHSILVYENGKLADRTAELEDGRLHMAPPRVERIFVERPDVRLVPEAAELIAGKDALSIEVQNLPAASVDVLYELDGTMMPPVRNWRMDGHRRLQVPLSASTPKGVYRFIGIRDAADPDVHRWLKVDIQITVK